jgi:hypothetical protein
MKNSQPLIFPLVLKYKGKLIHTKGIKCSYGTHETIYKIALPSSLSTVRLCWLIRDGETCKLEFNVEMEPALKTLLIDAVTGYDETKSIYPGLELKTA